MTGVKAHNDPWSPLPDDNVGIPQPPADPRYQLIDSDRYIESLEKKLKRVKGRSKPEPSPRDIIDSLACFRDDQMRRFLDKEQTVVAPLAILPEADTAATSGSISYLQRRLHPERQALNMEELFELLKDDELSRNVIEEEEESASADHNIHNDRLSVDCGNDSSTGRPCDKDGSELTDVGCSEASSKTAISKQDCDSVSSSTVKTGASQACEVHSAAT